MPFYRQGILANGQPASALVPGTNVTMNVVAGVATIAATGGGGGGGGASYSGVVTGAPFNFNNTSYTAIPNFRIIFPASATPITYAVFSQVVFGSNRTLVSYLALDGVQITQGDIAHQAYNDLSSDDLGLINSCVVTVPGDNATHEIQVYAADSVGVATNTIQAGTMFAIQTTLT